VHDTDEDGDEVDCVNGCSEHGCSSASVTLDGDFASGEPTDGATGSDDDKHCTASDDNCDDDSFYSTRTHARTHARKHACTHTHRTGLEAKI